MPIYEYRCRECGERFELRRSINDSDSEIKCPKCQAKHPERLVSLFASSSSSDNACIPSGST